MDFIWQDLRLIWTWAISWRTKEIDLIWTLLDKTCDLILKVLTLLRLQTWLNPDLCVNWLVTWFGLETYPEERENGLDLDLTGQEMRFVLKDCTLGRTRQDRTWFGPGWKWLEPSLHKQFDTRFCGTLQTFPQKAFCQFYVWMDGNTIE